MNIVVETLMTSVLIIYYTLEGIVRAILPYELLPKKVISKDTVLVTGGGSGIGRCLSIRLAKLGCQLVLWDVNEKGNKETVEEIERFGGKVIAYTVDISNREKVYSFAEKVLAEVGRVDILVNNAGILIPGTSLQPEDENIEKIMNVNTMSHFWLLNAFAPGMLERNYGHIVNMSSAAAVIAVPHISYTASKFASKGFIEALNIRMRRMEKSIDTTVVCPNLTNTPILKGIPYKPRFPMLLPFLEPDFVAMRIIQAIQARQLYLFIPKLVYVLSVLKGILPDKAFHVLTRYIGNTPNMKKQ